MTRPAPPHVPTVRRRAALVLACIGAAACGGTDPYAPIASFETALVGFQVYPLSTASPLLPTAISLSSYSSVRPAVRSNLTLNFDLAIDLDASGKVRLLPPRLVVSPQGGGSLVTGAQVVTGSTFDLLLRAPSTGYSYDSVTVVSPGQVVAISTQGAGSASPVCSTTSPIYAKLVVDSVRPVASVPGAQAIFLRARIDPNCGFRSLEPGIPKN